MSSKSEEGQEMSPVGDLEPTQGDQSPEYSISNLTSEDEFSVLAEDLDPTLRAELEQAQAARDLLAQLAPAIPPHSLPRQTARRVRRRLRYERSQVERGKLSGLVTVATILLVLSVIFLIAYKLREVRKRDQIEVIKLETSKQSEGQPQPRK